MRALNRLLRSAWFPWLLFSVLLLMAFTVLS